MPEDATPTEPPLSLTPNQRGGLWMLLAVCMATAMAILVRILSAEMHATMIAFLRSLVALGFVAPLLLRRRAAVRVRVSRPWLHLWRGLLITAALNLGYVSIALLPLATATILFFLTPLFATVLARLMFGEATPARRWAAVAAGFLGAVVVLRPGLAPLDAGTAAAIASAFVFALGLLVGRPLAAADGAHSVFATTTVATAVLSLPVALLHWRMPEDGAQWALVGLLAAVSSLRGYADIKAFAEGEASFVSTVSFLRLPVAAVAGWLLFRESPDAWALGGGAIIAAAALDLAAAEARRAARRAPAPAP